MVWQKTAAVSLTVLLLALQWRFLATPSQWYERAWNPDPEYGRFVDFMRATPGEILADDVALLYAAGKPLRYDDPSAMGPAARMGLWDEGGLLEDIEHKRFSAIMIPFNTDTDGRIDPSGRWTPAVLNAISIHYRIKFVDTFTIYEPKP